MFGRLTGWAQSDSLPAVSLNPVVVTATGTYHRASDSPLEVKVITASDLRQAQVTSVQEALSRLTSDVTIHTNGMGTFVNFDGISDEYVLILVDGQRLSGDDRWERLSISNIRRIEVQRGAAGALYGSDALAGVINIITDGSRERVQASSSTKWMNRGRLVQDITADATLRGVSSHTAYTHRQADNWQVSNRQAFDEGGTQVLKPTGRPMSVGFRSDNISERLEWRPSDRLSAYLRGNYYDYMTQRPRSATYFTQKVGKDADTGAPTYTYTERSAYTYDLHHQSYLYGGGMRYVPNARTHLYMDVYSDNFTSRYAYWPTSKADAYDETRKRTHYTNETLKGIFRLSSHHKLSAGLELEQEVLSSQSDNISHAATQTYNLYAQDEMRVTSWLDAVAGLRYTYNRGFHSALTPSAALFAHTGGWAFRTSYGGGYRRPTLSQLFATDEAKTTSRYTLGNPSLRPERNNYWRADVTYTCSWMNAGVSGFVNDVRDMINYRVMTAAEILADAHLTELHQVDGWATIRQRDNIDRARLRGVSVQLKFVIPCGLTLGGNYTFTDSRATTRILADGTSASGGSQQQYVETHTPVDKSVRHVSSVNASWDRSFGRYRLSLGATGRMQGRRYSSTYGYAPSCQQWDLTSRHAFRTSHATLEAGLGIENVFNQRDTSPWNSNFSTTNPGRSLYVSFVVKFSSDK